MPLKDLIKKEGYIETLSGISATLAGKAATTSNERSLPLLSQQKILVDVQATFDSAAESGAVVELLEGMTSGNISTRPRDGQSGRIDLVGQPVFSGFISGAGTPNYLDGATGVAGMTIGGVEYALVASYLDDALSISKISDVYLNEGPTRRKAFLFSPLAPYYCVRMRNTERRVSKSMTSISASVLEFPEVE